MPGNYYYLPKPYYDDPIFYANDYGFNTSASGATNSAALQAAIDAANTAGGGVVRIGFGTFNLATTSATFLRGGSTENAKYCVLLKDNVAIVGRGAQSILRIANDQQTNTVCVYLLYAPAGTDYWALEDVQLAGNTAGQTSYSEGYKQGDNAGGLLISGNNVSGCTGVRLKNVTFDDWFGIASDNIYPVDWVCEDLYVDDVGEGYQMVGYTNAVVRNYTYRNTGGHSEGDGLEIVNGTTLLLDGFNIDGAENGSALDLTGRNMRVLNGHVSNSEVAVVVQYDAANPVQPNSDGWLISNVTVKDCSAQAFLLTGGSNGTFRGTISNCRAESCLMGYNIGNSTGNSEVLIDNCTAARCTTAGLYIGAIDRVTVRGGDFSSNTEYGIQLVGACNVDIEGPHCENNTRFAVYVDPAATPTGRVHVYAKDNSTGDMSYFNVLDSKTYDNQDFYLQDPTITGLELVNTRRDETEALLATRVVTGYEDILWTGPRIRQLQNGCDGQRLRIKMQPLDVVTVEALADTAGNNIELYTDADGEQHFGDNDSLLLQWSAADEVWYELDRRQSYVTPFVPQDIVSFRGWYQSDALIYEDVGATDLAEVGDRVYVWRATGSGCPDLIPTGAAGRPTYDASGGTTGNGSDQQLTGTSIDLTGPFTIILRLAMPAATFTSDTYFSVWTGASGWYIASFQAATCLFSDSGDSNDPTFANGTLSTSVSQDVVVAIAVAANGTTTLYKSNGTTGSGGTTIRSATSNMHVHSVYGATFGTRAVRDIIVVDAIISTTEFLKVQGYFA